MKECRNYTPWKKMIMIWCSVTEVATSKQADMILLTLDSDGQNLALQVAGELRKATDGSGVKAVLKKLDELYEQNQTQQMFSAFEEFEQFKRDPSMSIAKYISAFDMKVSCLKDLEVTLPDSILAYKLLKNAGLSEDCTRIVRATCKELKLSSMKQSILNIFDVRLNSSGANGGDSSSMNCDVPNSVETEPFSIKTEPSDTYYGRYSERSDDNYHEVYEQYSQKPKAQSFVQKGPMRGRGKYRDPYPTHKSRLAENQVERNRSQQRTNWINTSTGKPSQCRLCGSIYHWARQCPRYGYDKNSNDALQTQTIDIQLFAEQLNRTAL